MEYCGKGQSLSLSVSKGSRYLTNSVLRGALITNYVETTVHKTLIDIEGEPGHAERPDCSQRGVANHIHGN